MQPSMDGRVLFHRLDKRKVAARVCLLENVAKIPNRLMRMNEQNQLELWRHGDELSPREEYLE